MSAVEILLPTEQEPLLDVRGLSKIFFLGGGSLFGRDQTRIKAVDDVSFAIWPGETLALVGESGSGKTTCARAVARLYRPDGGTIRFKGVDITRLSARALRPLRHGFQMMFQDPYDSLDPRQPIGAIIAEPLVIHRWHNAAARRERTAEVMAMVGLNPADVMRYPHEFSGGQRQRIAIARTLVLEPELIIADEPLSALDVSIQSQILNLLADLQSRLGFACLFITHDLAVVDTIADRVAVMKSGKIVEQGSRVEILTNPQHRYTRSLLAAVPRMGRGKRELHAETAVVVELGSLAP